MQTQQQQLKDNNISLYHTILFPNETWVECVEDKYEDFPTTNNKLWGYNFSNSTEIKIEGFSKCEKFIYFSVRLIWGRIYKLTIDTFIKYLINQRILDSIRKSLTL